MNREFFSFNCGVWGRKILYGSKYSKCRCKSLANTMQMYHLWFCIDDYYIGVNLHGKIFYVHTTMFHIQNIPHVRDLPPHWFIAECTFKSMQHIAGHAGLSEITLFLIFCFFKAQQESTIEITTHLHSYWQDNPPPTPSPPVLQPLAAETKSTKFTKKMKVLQKPGQHLKNLKRASGRFERVTEVGLETTCSRRVRDGIAGLTATFSLLPKNFRVMWS